MPSDGSPASDLWLLDIPPIAGRSRLYPLAPIGVGSRDAESLSSYVARLARAHAVEVRSLMRWEVYPRMEPRRSLRRWALNGSGRMAHRAVTALEHLTGRPDLRYLTFVPWAGVLDATPMLRRHRAWCGRCYAEWQEAGSVIYDPLVWAVAGVECCIRHGVNLMHACLFPDCRAQSSPVSARYQPGYCDACRHWLGTGGPSVTSDACDHREIAAIVGLFVEHGHDDPARLGRRQRATPATGFDAWRILARQLWPEQAGSIRRVPRVTE